MPKSNYKSAYLLLLVNSLLWGIAPVFIKLGQETLDTTTFLYYRFLIVGVIIGIVIIYRGQVRRFFSFLRKPAYLINMLFMNPINIVLSFWGVERTTAILASVASATKPIVADVMGVALLKEKMTRSELIGTVLAVIGLLLLIFIQNGNSGEANVTSGSSLIGAFLITLSGVVMVLSNIMCKRIEQKDLDFVSDASFVVGTIFFFIMAAILVPQNIVPKFNNWTEVISVGFMAIGSSIVALIAFQRALKHVEVSEANVFTYLQPLFGIPASIIILHENFTLSMFAPVLLVAVGIWLNVREKFIKKRVLLESI